MKKLFEGKHLIRSRQLAVAERNHRRDSSSSRSPTPGRFPWTGDTVPQRRGTVLRDLSITGGGQKDGRLSLQDKVRHRGTIFGRSKRNQDTTECAAQAPSLPPSCQLKKDITDALYRLRNPPIQMPARFKGVSDSAATAAVDIKHPRLMMPRNDFCQLLYST